MTASDRTDVRLRLQIGEASAALLRLDDSTPAAATSLVALVRVIADEAARSPRFANALVAALSIPAEASTAPGGAAAPVKRSAPGKPHPSGKPPVRRGKRAAGPFDPFAVFREGGEAGLRDKLAPLDVDALKDIIAEHAMDYDRLAMRWRTPSKLRDRIVERVKALATKGDVFR
ncbi:hypothetical protein [Rhodococcus chondri]|uniref:Uncharacterized protein n=1 Tax=Rhodococcus chondri TaxID=3065941 RepID=A0ABU7JMU0_9NOCA|nr:hypothetical protein [Rhodococcus sp. CC-R104]MEE2031356.1 hypothetical protein [Rhodococcus sp. CC-R104]